MNFSTYFKKLKGFLSTFRPKPKISILIPFNATDPQRNRVFKWTKRYWRNLPNSEIIIGTSNISPFCKTNALNNAAAKAKGDILVIMDADAYMDWTIIERCANLMLEYKENHLWFVPYRSLYRLTEATTKQILKFSPYSPPILPSPPPTSFIENLGHSSKYGHRYGAMCMMFPREAYNCIGSFDERFLGWGGEDIALLRALDTLYGKHKTTDNDIYHLWHPVIGENYKSRKWEGQEKASNNNNQLANQYHKATRNPSKMRALVEEYPNKFI